MYDKFGDSKIILFCWHTVTFVYIYVTVESYTEQRYDGYFNNIVQPSIGSAGNI